MKLRFFPLLISVALAWANTGCGLFDSHVKEMDTMRGLATDASSRLQDGSIGQMQVGGQAINPGVEVEGCIKYTASARYVGLSGQFMTSAQGTLSSREAPEYIQRIIMARDISEQQKLALVQEFLLKKLPEPAPPAITQPVD